MKEKLLKAVYFIICFAVLLVAIINISKYTRQLQNENTTETITANERQCLIDSLKVIYIQEKDSALNRLILSHEKELSKIKKQGIKTKIVYLYYVEGYNNDTLNQTPICDSIISSADFVIDNLEEQIDIYKDINLKQNQRILHKDSINFIINKQYESCKSTNDYLKGVINKKNNWWNRNKLGIGFGSGVVVTVGAIYGIYILTR